jgi:chemosensory pili system protein ChpA (sensor histidine kinase/response regulator)
MADLSGNLERLRQQLRDIELQSESQMQSRLAQSKDTAAGFDPLEFDRFTRVQELTRMMAESVNDVATIQRNLLRAMEGTEDDLIAQGRQARELQRDLCAPAWWSSKAFPSACTPWCARPPRKRASRSSWTSPVAPSRWTGGAGPHDPGVRAPAAQLRGARH